MENNDPVLYILMRTDLASLNPGKAMAQANHAYGALKKAVRPNIPMQQTYMDWMSQTRQEFGTTIVLGGSEGEINDLIKNAHRFLQPPQMICGWIHDPTYPVSDGGVTHLIPLNTCAYMFGRKNDIGEFVYLELHP